MRYLSFEWHEVDESVSTLEAMASTAAAQHAAALAEAQQVLDWARQHFPHTQGPADEGHDWDHELQVWVEDTQWHVVTLTLTASPRFAAEFLAAFGGPSGGPAA